MADKLTGPVPGLPLGLEPSKSDQVADFAEDLAEKASLRSTEREFAVEEKNPEAVARTERLRRSVREAGGNKVVAEKSGVPASTLGAYLAGRDWRIGTAVALADACGVDLEWLATGRPAISDAGSPSPELFKTVDVLRLGRAIDYIRERGGSTLPSVEFARAILIAYDLMSGSGE